MTKDIDWGSRQQREEVLKFSCFVCVYEGNYLIYIHYQEPSHNTKPPSAVDFVTDVLQTWLYITIYNDTRDIRSWFVYIWKPLHNFLICLETSDAI